MAGQAPLQRRVVAHQQRTCAVQIAALADVAVGLKEGHAEPEERAAPQFRLHADLAAHEVDQALADHQAETGTAVDARGRGIGLGEGLEQAFGRGRGDAHAGVLHLEQHLAVRARLAALGHAHADVALLGELDGVADQIGQDLAQAHGIAAHGHAHRRIDLHRQRQSLVLRRLLHQAAHRIEHLAQIETDGLQFQLVRLDLGVVEDVVDDAQQLACRAVGCHHVVALVGTERRPQHDVQQGDDAVERRADLMAHGGQEFALGEHRGLGVLLGLHELLLHMAQLVQLGHQTGGVGHGDGVGRDRGPRPFAARGRGLRHPGRGRGGTAPRLHVGEFGRHHGHQHQRSQPVAVRRRQQQEDGQRGSHAADASPRRQRPGRELPAIVHPALLVGSPVPSRDRGGGDGTRVHAATAVRARRRGSRSSVPGPPAARNCPGCSRRRPTTAGPHSARPRPAGR